jgi:hypothetical protein
LPKSGKESVIKTIILSLIIISLMIGAQSAFALYHGITDSQGRPCTFGPSHDECYNRFLERTTDIPAYKAGFKVGFHDQLKDGIYHHDKPEGGTHNEFWGDGYYDGWHKACLNSVISAEDCGVQEDANTP